MSNNVNLDDLQRVSAYHLRTYVVGSVLPVWRNKPTFKDIRIGLNSMLQEEGPDHKLLEVLACDGLALRAVSWKTSSSMVMHASIMQLAGEDMSIPGTAFLSSIDPSIDGLRSAKFLGDIRHVLGQDDISDVERSLLLATVLSLVCVTPPHPLIALGDWREKRIDMIASTAHLDGANVIAIPDADMSILLQSLSQLPTTDVPTYKSGWADKSDRDQALGLLTSSAVLLVGVRHVSTEKDNLLIDPSTRDISCTHDAAHNRTIVHGETPAVMDIPLHMFTLHLSIVIAAALRVVAKHTEQDRDTMMQSLLLEPPMFGQSQYFAKKVTSKAMKATKIPRLCKPAKTSKMPSRPTPASNASGIATIASDLSAFKLSCEARFTSLERQPLKRSRSLL